MVRHRPHALAGAPRGIVVEGTDCSGKSCLIRHLRGHLGRRGWDVLQMGHRDGDQFRRYFDIYDSADRLIFDRAHISEIVYGEIEQRCDRLTNAERDALNGIVRREFVTILCTAPPEVIWERHRLRAYAQPPLSFERLASAHHAFIDAMAPTATFVFESHPVDLTCEAEVAEFFDAAACTVLEGIAGMSAAGRVE